MAFLTRQPFLCTAGLIERSLFRAGQNQVSSAQLAVEKWPKKAPVLRWRLPLLKCWHTKISGVYGGNCFNRASHFPSYQILPALHRTPIGPCILQSSSWPPLTLELLTNDLLATDVPKSTQSPNRLNSAFTQIRIKKSAANEWNYHVLHLFKSCFNQKITGQSAAPSHSKDCRPCPAGFAKASSTSRMAGGTSLEVSFFTWIVYIVELTTLVTILVQYLL